MVNGGDGPLVAALRNDPVDGPRALEMLKRPGTFKADDEEAKAFFLIFGQVIFLYVRSTITYEALQNSFMFFSGYSKKNWGAKYIPLKMNSQIIDTLLKLNIICSLLKLYNKIQNTRLISECYYPNGCRKQV
jgi:hypothetical protein